MSTFLKESSDYFATRSALHVDVKDSSTNRAFCRFVDRKQFEAITNNLAKNIVLIRNFSGGAVGGFEEASVKNLIVIRFSSYSKNVSSGEITIAVEKAFDIMLDFWTRMRYDFEQNNCSWLKGVIWEGIDFDEIPEQPWLQNHYGWDLFIPFKTYLPNVDAEKWIDELSSTPGNDINEAVTSPNRLIARFKVGAAGAPMTADDTTFTHADLADKNFVVLSNGVVISQIADDVERYVSKPLNSDTITFHGGVTNGEELEIYKA